MSERREHDVVGCRYESGHLDPKTFHLIRIATNLAAGNGYCAKWSIEPLRAAGATQGEIMETIGMAVRAGASLVWQEAIDNFPDDVTPPRK